MASLGGELSSPAAGGNSAANAVRTIKEAKILLWGSAAESLTNGDFKGREWADETVAKGSIEVGLLTFTLPQREILSLISYPARIAVFYWHIIPSCPALNLGFPDD